MMRHLDVVKQRWRWQTASSSPHTHNKFKQAQGCTQCAAASCMNRLPAFLLTSLAALAAIAACTPSEDHSVKATFKEPTIYFRNGLEITVGDASVPIHGMQDCPYGLAAPVGAVTAMNDAKCIRLADDTQQIQVLLDLPSGQVQEEWAVRRDGPSQPNEPAFKHVSLLRPDGSRITITDKSDKLLDKCYAYEAAHVCL